MFNKKFFRVIAILLFSAAGSMNMQASDYVRVSTGDGEAAFFSLDEKPTVSFSAGHLVMTTSTTVVEYPVNEYRSFEIVPRPTDVTDFSAAVFSVGNTVAATGLPAGSELVVCSVTGELVGRVVADVTGHAEIPMSGRTGVFVVKSKSKTFKFIRKQ